MGVETGQNAEAQDIISSNYIYAADAGANDTYVIALPEAPASYTDGLTVRFKANTANTGASTLNVNSLGAIAIKRPDLTDTQTGDIVANQIVEVVYRGGTFYMISPINIEERFTAGAMRNTLVKTFFNVKLLFILWVGSVVNDTTTTFINWTSESTSRFTPLPTGAMAKAISTGSTYLCTALSAFVVSNTATDLTWDKTNIVVMDFWAILPATSTGDIFMGFAADNGYFDGVYNNTTDDRVGFHIRGSTGLIYATSCKSGTGVTNTDISSGITNTNRNNFRIELDLSNNALLYINGVLKTTLSGANFYTGAGRVLCGFGRSDTALFVVTAPDISLEMNP